MKIEDYHDVMTEFCHDNPGLQIYTAGQISHPGISDLDFLVLDEEPKISQNVRKFLKGGNVIVYPSQHFYKLNSIEKFTLKCIQGDDIQPLSCVNPGFDYVEILEWLPERICLLESLYSSTSNKPELFLDSTQCIQRLLYIKSINRSIENVEKLTGSIFLRPNSDEIRTNYHKRNLNQDIQEYIKSARVALLEFNSRFKFLQGEMKGEVNFSKSYQFRDSGSSQRGYHKLLLYYAFLLSIQCELTDQLKKCVKLEGTITSINPGFCKFVSDRWLLLDEIYRWHKTKGHIGGMIKYGWLLAP